MAEFGSIRIEQSGAPSRLIITLGPAWRRRVRRVARRLEISLADYLREIIIADVVRREDGFGLGEPLPLLESTRAAHTPRSRSTQERLTRFLERLPVDKEFDRAAVLKSLPDAHPGTVSVYLGWLRRSGRLTRRRNGSRYLYRKAEAQCA